jgi:Putative Flp pilus-assembly TadE/G-like
MKALMKKGLARTFLVTRKFHESRYSQGGVALIWVAMCLMIILALVGIVIESSRKTTMTSEIQHASDAAAVAAAAELDGTINGWLNAKRVAVAVIQSQTIPGVTTDLSTADFVFTQGGKEDVLEDSNSLRDVTAQVGNLKVTIERGAYWPGSGNATVFESFEGKQATQVTNATGDKNLPLHQTLPTYLLANAVQVTLEVGDVTSVFGGVVGSQVFGSMTRSSTAITDEQVEECVIPAAVPACAVMLELSPSVNNLYYTDRYRAGQQCQREFLVTEANPLGPADSGGYYHERADGMLRSGLYPRFPYSEGILNKKAIGLYGVLGVADEDAQSGEVAMNSEVIDALKSNCVNVKVGSRFKPVENAVGPGGLYTTRGTELTNQLRILLSTATASSSTISSTFGIPGDDEKPAQLQYPYINSQGKELIRDFQTDPDKITRVNLGEPPAGASSFTNPLCHDYGGVEPNDRNSGVAQVKLMVIAPTATDYYSNAGAYCDFRAVFGGQQANTTAPLGRTDPVVVGFVTAYLFDFNVTHYGDEGSPDEDLDVSPVGYSLVDKDVVDRPRDKNNDGEINDKDEEIIDKGEIEKSTREFITQHKDWAVCESKPLCLPDQTPATHQCRTEPCDGKKATPLGIDDKLAALLAQPDECVKKPDMSAWESCRNSTDPEGIQDYGDKFLDSLTEAGGPMEPKKYCLPERKSNCTDSDDESCFEPLTPKAPQWGCGGLRLRLSCEQPSLAVSRSPDQIVPAIVK